MCLIHNPNSWQIYDIVANSQIPYEKIFGFPYVCCQNFVNMTFPAISNRLTDSG